MIDNSRRTRLKRFTVTRTVEKRRDRRQTSDKLITLREVVQDLVRDGSSLTFGGFCGRNSQATAYEIIRQKKGGLVFIDDSPTDQLDMLIGAGCLSRVEIAWHGICSISVRASRESQHYLNARTRLKHE